MLGKQSFKNTGIKSITFPASAVAVGRAAFQGCRQLKSVNFAPGSQLRIIKKWGFSDSGLEELTIPSCVTTIHADTFRDCRDLRTVTFEEGSKLKTI